MRIWKDIIKLGWLSSNELRLGSYNQKLYPACPPPPPHHITCIHLEPSQCNLKKIPVAKDPCDEVRAIQPSSTSIYSMAWAPKDDSLYPDRKPYDSSCRSLANLDDLCGLKLLVQ